jgi:hypothetical protein
MPRPEATASATSAASAASADRIEPPASVAQWKSSSVLRKRLGVRVPPGAQSFFASDLGFLPWSDHRKCVFARFLPAFLKLWARRQATSRRFVGSHGTPRTSILGVFSLDEKLSNLLSAATAVAGVGRTGSAGPTAAPPTASAHSVASRLRPDRPRRDRRRCRASSQPTRVRASAARP